MKKIFAILIALVLTFAMSAVAFADGVTDKYDKAPVVSKTYEVKNGTAPAETFTFSFTGVSYKDADGKVQEDANIPAISPVTISFDAISSTTIRTATASVNADDYALGVYTYKVTETAGSTAGVDYSDEELYLVLTILHDETNGKHYVAAMHYEAADGDKTSAGFKNEYNSGSLTVSKKITGNMAELTDKFQFTVTFTAPENTTMSSTISTDATTGYWNGNVYTISLGNNERVKFSNIPAGVTYEVVEDAGSYTSSSVFSDEQKTISANDEDTAVFTNTKSTTVDTGITMDSIPYIVLLAVAVVGIAAMTMKKRYEA